MRVHISHFDISEIRMHLSLDGIWQSLSFGTLLMTAYVQTRSWPLQAPVELWATCWHNAIKMSLKRLRIIQVSKQKRLLLMQKGTGTEQEDLHLISERQVNPKGFY